MYRNNSSRSNGSGHISRVSNKNNRTPVSHRSRKASVKNNLPANPRMREKMRREKLRQQQLRKKKIRRNRIIAAVVLGIIVFALASIVRLIFHRAVWSMDAGDFSPGKSSPKPEPGNTEQNDDDISGIGYENAEDIYNLKDLDSITIKRVNDYRDSISVFRMQTLNQKDLHRGDLVLINEKNPLPQDFSPQGLVNMWENRKPGVVGLKDTSQLLAKNAISTVYHMFEDMKNDGAGKCVIVSAYRTVEYQHNLLDEEIESYKEQGFSEQEAMARALEFIAKPGRSEHNYGYAIDVSAEDDNGYLLSGDFEHTTQGKWLKEKSWRYGYIIRYPSDKVAITGIGYEPWHLRYVGYPHAAVMKKLNMCLEEYIDYIVKEKSFDVYIGGRAAYRIYYVDADQAATGNSDSEKTYKINVPEDVFSQEGKEKWSISGTGLKGFIVTTELK